MTLEQLAKKRGIYFRSQQSYGGSSGFMVYGPVGTEIKKNIEQVWRLFFVHGENNSEISSPNVMVEDVFESSGHLDTFDDLIVSCDNCGSQQRADHLIEDQTSISEAESFDTVEAAETINDNEIACRDCGAVLHGENVRDFNLMFETSIGPGNGTRGYLRPETAQGIFAEFHRLKQYLRGSFPAGIAQVGRSYRNEISPRGGLQRLRELSQAELEKFVLPGQSPPEMESQGTEVTLYSKTGQSSGDGPKDYTLNECLKNGVIEEEWIAYYIWKSVDFYESIGIQRTKLRFRQHMEDELSHYASDCWDAEALIDGEWVEITGFAFRGCHDLKQHHKNSSEDFKVFEEYDQAKEIERTKVDVDMSVIGPEYGNKASDIKDALVTKLEQEGNPGYQSVRVSVDEDQFDIPPNAFEVTTETKRKEGRRVFPHVVEPSFGVDRLVLGVLDHSLEKDVVSGDERQLLSLPQEVSPYDVAVLPLMNKDGLSDKAEKLCSDLRQKGVNITYETSGSIGKRYRKMDEIGVKYCVTVDYETLGEPDSELEDTVTLRERDSTEQKRVDLGDVASEIRTG